MAEAESSRATAHLLQFVAFEIQVAFAHIGRAMAEYSETGVLPPSMFVEPRLAIKRQKRKDKGQKRKPSAFNNFVKERMAEIRAKANGNEDEVVANGVLFQDYVSRSVRTQQSRPACSLTPPLYYKRAVSRHTEHPFRRSYSISRHSANSACRHKHFFAGSE